MTIIIGQERKKLIKSGGQVAKKGDTHKKAPSPRDSPVTSSFSRSHDQTSLSFFLFIRTNIERGELISRPRRIK